MSAEVLPAADGAGWATSVARAVEVLNGGGLVVFPTETVYGIAARADMPEALARLNVVKGRPADKPYTLHIGDRQEVFEYAPRISLPDRQLLKRSWPGPLTAVFTLTPEEAQGRWERLGKETYSALYYENTIGVRVPDHPAARQLLLGSKGPVIAPSANKANGPPPTTAAEAMAAIGQEVDLILDGGPCRFRKPSTVIKLRGAAAPEVLREGVFDERMLKGMRVLNLLFVCTGNSCRSPMAEGLARQMLAMRLNCSIDRLAELGYNIGSAGVMAWNGAPATAEAVAACQELGVDISGHRSQPVSEPLVYAAERIFVMTRGHAESIRRMFPATGGRVVLLAGEDDIDDPLGGTLAEYDRCARKIQTCLAGHLDELLSQSNRL